MNQIEYGKLKKIQDANLSDKTVVVRLDLNVPMKNGEITDPSRIVAAFQTLDYLIQNRCKIIVLSHLSRIKKEEDITSGKKSLLPVSVYIKNAYPNSGVYFAQDNTNPEIIKVAQSLKIGDILILENTRYQDFDMNKKEVVKKESKCDMKLASFWASLGEIFINDAFATIHRKHASNYGVGSIMKESYVGFLIQNELTNILKFNKDSKKPIVSIIGGAKISDKIILLKKIIAMSDKVLIGGGMAYTFLKALGKNIGTSLCEEEMLQTAKDLYIGNERKIVLPVDVMCAEKFEDVKGKKFVYDMGGIPVNMQGLDIGPKTIKLFTKEIQTANTIFWNGPCGVFEFKHFAKSTKKITKVIVKATAKGAFSLIGGGDTASAATSFENKDSFSFVSTGGGATLAIIQDEDLPGLFFGKEKAQKLHIKVDKTAQVQYTKTLKVDVF